MHLEILMKQYLELSQVVPDTCKTERELRLLRLIEQAYGLLWRDTASSEKTNEARKLLLSVLDKSGQKRGVEFAIEKYGPVSDAEALRDFP